MYIIYIFDDLNVAETFESNFSDIYTQKNQNCLKRMTTMMR